MKDKMREDIVLNKPGNILAKLFRTVLKDRGLLYTWQTIVDKYIAEKKSSGEKGSTAHNIKADIQLTDMTFNKLIFLLKEALSIKIIRIDITLTDKYGEKTYHTSGDIRLEKKEETKE